MAAQKSVNPTIDFEKLRQMLCDDSLDDGARFRLIVNTPFRELRVETAFLFLGIIVLLLVNKKTGQIDRVALSNTELAKLTTDVSVVPFQDIKIPVDYHKNIIAKAISTGEPQDTIDWRYLFEPGMSAEHARINQANAGIAYSAVYPIKARDGAAMIFSYYQYEGSIGKAQHDFMRQYTEAVERSLA
jgi:hypothetical protein